MLTALPVPLLIARIMMTSLPVATRTDNLAQTCTVPCPSFIFNKLGTDTITSNVLKQNDQLLPIDYWTG